MESSGAWPGSLRPCTHIGDPEKAADSHLGISSALVIVVLLESEKANGKPLFVKSVFQTQILFKNKNSCFCVLDTNKKAEEWQ